MLLSFEHDRVPNLRFNLAKALERLAPRLDAATLTTVVRPKLQALMVADDDADVRFYASRALAAMPAA